MNKLFTLILTLLCSAGAVSAEGISIYLEKSTAFASANYFYAWKDNPEEKINGVWPGKQMTSADVVTVNGVEYYHQEFDPKYTSLNIIFHNNSGNAQTSDIKNITKTTFYRLNSKSGKTISVTELQVELKPAAPVIRFEDNVMTITADSGADIFYTLDGSEPSAASTAYTEPVALDDDAYVRAIAIKGDKCSDVAEAAFVWTFTAPADGRYIYYVADRGAAVPEICATTMPYLPIEGGTKASGQPDALYLQGNIKDHQWITNYSYGATRYGDCFVWDEVTLIPADGNPGDCYFSFSAAIGSDWNAVNGNDRWGAKSKDLAISEDTPAEVTKYAKNVSASSCNSWKIASGTYRIIVNFTTNQVTLTKKDAPAWQPMYLTTIEDHHVSFDGKDLYRFDLAEANALKVGFRTEASAVVAGTAAENDSYILNGTLWEVTSPVAVAIKTGEFNVHTEASTLIPSEGTHNAVYTYGYEPAEISGSTALEMPEYTTNAVVDVQWFATNAQGITYHGTHSVIRAFEDVNVCAVLPEGWTGIRYHIDSRLDHNHTLDGFFEDHDPAWPRYLSIKVPAHLMFSTITLTDSATPTASTSVRRAPSAEIIHELNGQSMYMEWNGDYWYAYPLELSGIEDTQTTPESEIEYFDLRGMRMASPDTLAPGIYIARQGTSLRKIYVN